MIKTGILEMCFFKIYGMIVHWTDAYSVLLEQRIITFSWINCCYVIEEQTHFDASII